MIGLELIVYLFGSVIFVWFVCVRSGFMISMDVCILCIYLKGVLVCKVYEVFIVILLFLKCIFVFKWCNILLIVYILESVGIL